VSTHDPLWRSAQARALVEARDVGGVIRFARQARGWRQADLGAAAGYSAATISRVETGHSTSADFDKLQRISREVGIPSSVLGELLGILPTGIDRLAKITGQRAEEDDPVRRRSLLAAGLTVPLGLLTALDDALASLPVPATNNAPDVALYLSRARKLYDTGDLARLVAGLPRLLAIAHVRAEQTKHPDDYARSAASYDLATEALNKIGHLAASRITADRSMMCARLSGSPIAAAASARCLSIVLRHEGREQIADRITLDAAAILESTGLVTAAEAATYAQMLCTCAYTAAQAGDRDRALEMIADAERAAIQLPTSGQGQPFSVTAAHVGLYRVGVHWSLGDAGAAVNVGRRLHPGQFPTPERRGRLFTDLARAWWQWGKPEQTVHALLAAHSHAPAEVRDRSSIRKIVTDVARQHPNISGVRELTEAVGLQAQSLSEAQSLSAFRPAHRVMTPCLRQHADEHAQTSVSEHGDHHSPRPAGGPDGAEAARRVAQAGRATIRRQNPSSRGRGTEGLCLGPASLHSGHLRGVGPEPGNLEGS
jgi:transcriptional regulator with XRE-family HTH domain